MARAKAQKIEQLRLLFNCIVCCKCAISLCLFPQCRLFELSPSIHNSNKFPCHVFCRVLIWSCAGRKSNKAAFFISMYQCESFFSNFLRMQFNVWHYYIYFFTSKFIWNAKKVNYIQCFFRLAATERAFLASILKNPTIKYNVQSIYIVCAIVSIVCQIFDSRQSLWRRWNPLEHLPWINTCQRRLSEMEVRTWSESIRRL